MSRGKGLRLLCIGQCLQIGGLSLSLPYMALYLNRERGIGMGTVGLLLAGTMLACAFGQAAGGALSDREGRRPVMVGSLLGRAALTFVMAAAVLGRWPVGAIAAAHMAAAFAGNLYFPAANAWIAERWERHERSEAFGWLRVAGNLGWAVGPAVGGFFMAASYALMFAASAAVCLAVAGYLRASLGPDEPASRPRAALGPGLVTASFSGAVDRRFARLCGWVVVLGVVMSQLVAPLSVYAVTVAGVAPERVGFLFTINGGLVVLLQPPVSRWARGARISSVMALGALFYAAGYAVVGLASSFSGLAAAMVVLTLGETAVTPGQSALAANLAGAGEAGRYTGLIGFSHQVGSALGPLLGGVMLERLSPRSQAAPWLVISLLALASWAGLRGLGRRLDEGEDGFRRMPLAGAPLAEAA